jgi:hypothetical protein
MTAAEAVVEGKARIKMIKAKRLTKTMMASGVMTALMANTAVLGRYAKKVPRLGNQKLLGIWRRRDLYM